jgi:hypothetical protein
MKNLEGIFKQIDQMKETGAEAAEIGRFAYSTGYDVPALQTAYKDYKATGEVNEAGVGSGLLQGLTFGFSEEIGGALAEVGLNPFADPEDNYESYVNKQRSRYKLFQQKNPILSSGAEILGSLPTLMLPGGAIAKTAQASGKLATVAKGAAIAGGEGALYGAGTAEGGAAQRLEGAVEEGAISAAFGGPLALAGRAVSGATRMSRMAPEQRAVAQVSKRIDQLAPEARTAIQSPDLMQEGMTIADVGGEQLQRQLRGIRTLDAEAGKFMNDVLGQRYTNQFERITTQVNKAFESSPELVSAIKGDIDKLREVSKSAYTEAYLKHDDLKSGQIASIVSTDKEMGKLYDQTVKLMADEAASDGNEELARALRQLDKSSALTDESIVPLRVLDTMKKNMDESINSYYRAPGVNAVFKRKTLKNKQTEFINAVNKATDNDYGRLRGNFAESAKIEEALELGRKFEDKNIGVLELRETVNSFSPLEAKAYTAGVLQSIYKKIEGTPYGRDSLNVLLKSPLMEKQLKAIFPNNSSWNRFKAAMMNEAKMSRTKNLVTGGSNTADKLKDADLEDNLLADALLIASDPTGMLSSNAIMRNIQKFAENLSARIRTRSSTRGLQAKILLEADPKKKAELLQKMQEAKAELAQQAVGAEATGMLTGRVAGRVAAMAGDEE